MYLWILNVALLYRSKVTYFEINQTPIFMLVYIPIIYFYFKKTSILIFFTYVFTVLAFILSKTEASQFFALQAYIMIILTFMSYLYTMIKK